MNINTFGCTNIPCFLLLYLHLLTQLHVPFICDHLLFCKFWITLTLKFHMCLYSTYQKSSFSFLFGEVLQITLKWILMGKLQLIKRCCINNKQFRYYSNGSFCSKATVIRACDIINADYTIIMSRTLKVTGIHVVYDRVHYF